ncbi:MAG: prenyltransferase/squalene oxidase repeat-containing protein [Verrucomicrobiota bacterium]
MATRLRAALRESRRALLAQRNAAGHWTGELSTSALSTATAVCALAIVRRECAVSDPRLEPLIRGGLEWLAAHANADGGWGDTTLSVSNISTTTLCWAAFGVVPDADEQFRAVVQRAEAWLEKAAGGVIPEKLVPAIIRRYGKDRTFSVPILTTCALAGRLGHSANAWRHVLPLPFELAAFPAGFYAALRLPVVSYALPALIAIGQARHVHRPSWNPLARLVRQVARQPTLRVLERIQPRNGGFLEATPLTSFVTMSLAGSGQVHHRVTRKAVDFLVASVRPDGSWPIDTNLATWLTTLSLNALAAGGPLDLPANEREPLQRWLLSQQYRSVHPYTNAAPGGWAWTDLPGGVPDADDTAGALLALHHLRGDDPAVGEAVALGIGWLLDLQNSDGGIPTFCRGWTNLPFDRSGPDLTAHAMRAWAVWLERLPAPLQARTHHALDRARAYLVNAQRANHSWLPLWFGNQHAPEDENPAYGTARVLEGLMRFNPGQDAKTILAGAECLAQLQQENGAWSACAGGPPSVEETALAVESLATVLASPRLEKDAAAVRLRDAVARGACWLATRVEDGTWTQPSPIGFYFAKLWYYEKLYPMIFTTGALSRALRVLRE